MTNGQIDPRLLDLLYGTIALSRSLGELADACDQAVKDIADLQRRHDAENAAYRAEQAAERAARRR